MLQSYLFLRAVSKGRPEQLVQVRQLRLDRTERLRLLQELLNTQRLWCGVSDTLLRQQFR